MTLSPEDAQLFYHLWLPLLDFTNRKYHINPRLKKITKASELHPADAKEIANKLWENVTIIDAYLKGAPDHPRMETKNLRKVYRGKTFEKRLYFYLRGKRKNISGQRNHIDLGRDVFRAASAAFGGRGSHPIPRRYHI